MVTLLCIFAWLAFGFVGLFFVAHKASLRSGMDELSAWYGASLLGTFGSISGPPGVLLAWLLLSEKK